MNDLPSLPARSAKNKSTLRFLFLFGVPDGIWILNYCQEIDTSLIDPSFLFLFFHGHEVELPLATQGALKKDKKLWDGLPKKPPYELPEGWVWTCLQDVFEISRGGSPQPADAPAIWGGPIPWITVREITKDGEKYLTSTETGLTEERACRRRFIESDDLLLTNSGATLQRSRSGGLRSNR